MPLAFRLYGDFLWPPAAKIEQATGRENGCVEIHYAPKGGKHHAYLRWIPRGREKEPEQFPSSSTPNLQEKSHSWFADEANACLPIWIDGPAKTEGREHAVFRGAHLLVKYGGTDKASASRFPLVPRCKLDGRDVDSQLVVRDAQDGDKSGFHARFDLDVMLPLPAARTETDPVAVFPLLAVHYAIRQAQAVGRIDMLLARDYSGGAPTSLPFDLASADPDRSLGGFDLAARGKGEHGFVVNVGGNVKRFWPRTNTVAAAALTQLGIGAWGQSGPVDPEDISDAHLRFIRTAKTGAAPTGLIYRLAISGSNLKVDATEEVGGAIEVGNRLFVDLSLSWNFPDGDDAMHEPASWTFDVDARLIWPETVKASDFGPSDASKLTFGRRLLVETATKANATREGLKHVEGAQPVSLLPVLKRPNTTPREVYFALYVPPVARGMGAEDGLVPWPSRLRADLRLTLADDAHLASVERPGGGNILPLSADLPGFLRWKNGTATGLRIELRHDRSWPFDHREEADGPPYFASFAVSTSASPAAWTGRIGSLQFKGSGKLDTGEEDLNLLRTAGRGLGRTHAKTYLGDGHLSASLRLSLSVARVTPVSTDVARTDRTGRPAPLLVPLYRPDCTPTEDGSASAEAPGFFILRTTELFSGDQDRLLTASLFDKAQDVGERGYVILAEEPFSILRYSQAPLGALGNAGTVEVALYSSDDRVWQYLRAARHHHYVLPPQAIGESADKPRRLELHDLKPGDGAGDEPVPAPFADVPDGEDVATSRNLRRRAVEFRLMPSTEVWISPSDVARGYFMPEQASFELFRQRGEYGLGAALAGLRGEFLYGLSVGVDVGKENSVARYARVAEIGALTGAVVGRARELDADGSIASRWDSLSRAIARRPERLEIWTRDPDSPVDFAPARFAAGVSFALRSTALHRAPLAEAETVEADREFPTSTAGGPRFHPHGLSGGSLWPIESLNLLRILGEKPASRGGTLEGVALSPLGGDAAQSAEFLGGIVAILSETRNGHVERHKVEVTGRIGALWHRAKHVVVYERTVNPSAQFAPFAEEDPLRTRSRRPILRKVREYIELIEPERAYPDFSQALPRSAGFLDRVRFNSRIINVDSAWSREVGDFGWTIPLWNRAGARARPQAYPMPDIAFVTVAEGEGEAPVVAQECLDPDQLYFFADFTAETSDTDLWPARIGVDYVDLPLATVVAAVVDERSSSTPDEIEGTDGRRPSVTRFLPGARRFTWRLAPAGRKTAINAGRSAKPVYVGLESVSFMRASFETKDAGKAKFEELGLAAMMKAAGGIEAGVRGDLWAREGGGAADLPPETAAFIAAVGALRDAAAKKDGEKLAQAKRALDKTWPPPPPAGPAAGPAPFPDSLGVALAEKAGGLIADLKTHKAGLLDKVAIPKGKARCEQLKADAVGLVKRKGLLVRTILEEWQAAAEDILTKPVETKDAAIDSLCDEIEAKLAPIFREASKDVGNLANGIEAARAVLQAIEWEIEAQFDKARQRVEQVSAGYDREKPWSPERRRAFRGALRAALSGVAGEIEAAVSEGRQRLVVEIDELGQAMAGHLAALLGKIAKEKANLIGDLGSAKQYLSSELRALAGHLDKLLPGDAGRPGALDKAIQAIVEAEASVAAEAGLDANLKKAALDVLSRFEGALRATMDACSDVRGMIAAVDQAAEVGFEDAVTLAEQIGEIAGASIEAIVAALEDVRAQAEALADAGFTALSDQVSNAWSAAEEDWASLVGWLDAELDVIEATLANVEAWIGALLRRSDAVRESTLEAVRALHGRIDGLAADATEVIEDLSKLLGPEQLLKTVVIPNAVRPALVQLLAPIDDEDLAQDFDAARAEIRRLVRDLAERVDALLGKLTEAALGDVAQVASLCGQLAEGVEEAQAFLQNLADRAEAYFAERLAMARRDLEAALGDLPEDLGRLVSAINAFDRAVRGLHNDVVRAGETAKLYGDRVLDAAGRLGEGGVMALPNKVLKLYSAVSSAPELAGLKSDIDRIRSGFDELSEVIETTEASALFNRLGDELKALGLSIPFNGIADRLLPTDLSRFDIGRIFRDFGGTRFDGLFKGFRLPAGLGEAVRVTHDFDKKQARAWVQVDIDAPMPGRRSLFSIGPFTCDFVDMRLIGQVRLEASKDTERVTQTGFGRIGTTMDMVVSGQSMVRFEKFALNFSKESGLKIDFDPKNIRLNPAFEFVQEALGGLFPDALGPLTVVKENGVPIGVEHEFALPPISMNAVTSGISNISIENRFRLIAHPDFVIADRFSLSRPERPFIFSIFILGGAGYVQIEAEYRPFNSELTVTVDASAGASALLGISAGPFSGQVFITLSAVLSYRKTIGRPGGGLSVSAMLVIAGNVDVMGMVSVGIYVVLRITYRDNGQVDADGTLAVTIKISRFFKIRARADVRYRLRGGRAQVQASSSAGYDVTDPKVAKAIKAAEKLSKAVG